MRDDFPQRAWSRRDFIRRLSSAGFYALSAAGIGRLFYDANGPSGQEPIRKITHLRDYSIASKNGRLAVVRGRNRSGTVRLALEALGGLSAFVQPGERVLLKVNAAFAAPPILSSTTHPQLVEAVTKLCFEAGAAEVMVTDNPINDPASCFSLSGIGEAARRAGARVVMPRPDAFGRATLPGGRLIVNWPFLQEPFKKTDKLIGLAPVKDHHRSGASMSIKNWYGLLGGRRNIFHQKIHDIITELALWVRPTLVILDGTTTLMTNGPTGGSLSDIKMTDTMIAATDPVAADAFGATLLAKQPADLPFLDKAVRAGAGTADYRSLNPVEINAPTTRAL